MAANAGASDLDELMRVSIRTQMFSYMSVSAFTFLIAEYFQTIALEKALLWPTKWTLVKVLYYLNRYVIFVPVIITSIFRFIKDTSHCKTTFIVSSMSMFLPSVASEVILFFRVWALAERDRRLMIFLTVFLTISMNTALGCFIVYIRDMRYVESPIPSIIGCITLEMNQRDRLLIVGYVLVFLEQSVIMAICLYLGFKKHLRTKSPLVRTFFVDGGVYFTALSLMTLTTAVILFCAPNGYQFVLASYQGALQSALTTRMFLNLRYSASKDLEINEILSREIELMGSSSNILSPNVTSWMSSFRARPRAEDLNARRFWPWTTQETTSEAIDIAASLTARSTARDGER